MTITRRDLMLGAGALGLSACAPGIEIGDGVRYRIPRLTVLERNERRDEPYLALIGFRGIPGQPGSIGTRISDFADDRAWAEGTNDGTTLAVPRKMGEMEFARVRSLEFTGLFVVAMEWDRSPASTVRSIANAIAANIEDRLRTAIGSFASPAAVEEIPDWIEESQRRAFRALAGTNERLGPLDVAALFAESVGDPDDVVGTNILLDYNANVQESFLFNSLGHRAGYSGPLGPRSTAFNLQESVRGGKYRAEYEITII